MKNNLVPSFNKLVFIFSFFLVTISANAQTTITSWNFEPFTGTDTAPTPNTGFGSASIVNLGGGTIGSTGNYQATGMLGTGCGAQNGSLFGSWALNPFDPGTTNESNGARFNVSTLTYQNILLTWDQRFSNTSPNTVRLQYTTDGSTWNNFIMTSANTTLCAGSINANGCFENDAADVYRRISVNLSAINAINNNPNFAVRMLASYYQSTGQFRQSGAPSSAAGTTGTWRFDNVTISGTTLTGPNPSVISGTATICAGNSTVIKVTITGGASPYVLVYTDGTSNFTINNYTSGSNITVSPASSKTYSIVSVTDASANVGTGNSGSAVITVNPIPTVTFTTQPGTTACQNTDTTYTTQAGQSNYVWTFSGTLGTDYTITSGGTSTSNSVVVKWLNNTGTKTVSVNYSNASGCPAASATTSVASTIYVLPATPTFLTPLPAANVCAGSNITYTTQTGRFNYLWSIPGFAGIDYNIVSGGNATSNTLVLNWITTGSKTVTVNYSNQLTPNCGALISATFTNNVNAVPVITSQPSTAAQSTCIGTPFTPISVTATGVNLTYLWYGNATQAFTLGFPSGGAPTGGSSASLNAPATPAGVRYYYVVVGSPGCSSVKSNVYTGAYTVNALSVGGNIAGSTTICSGTNSTVLTLSGHTGSITKWQSSNDAAFSAPFDIANTATTLTVTNLATTTYFRAVITSGVCASANSNIATIAVSPVSIGGTLAGSTTLCSSTTTSTLSLSGQTGTIIKWQSSTTSDFSASITDIVNTSNTLSVTNLSATTYYRVVVQSSPCSISYSSIAQLTFKSTTWNGTIWSAGVPDSTTKAIFGALYTSAGSGAGDLQACSLQVLTNAIVTVKSGDTFTIQNEVKIPSSMLPTALILEDSSNLIQVNSVINTDYIYYRRNSMPIKQYDYTYWSSPVQNQTLSAFSPNSNLVYRWDNTIYNWVYVSTASTMVPATGYIIRAPDVAPFNPTTNNVFNGEFFGIPNNGDITTPVIASGANDLNLLGNPYPSALDADSFLIYNQPLNGGSLASTMYFWTHNTPYTANNYTNNDYASYNLTGGIGTMAASNPCAGCNSSIPNGKVAAGQSFFIHAVSNGDATFTNAMRFGVNNQFFKSNAVVNAIEKNRFWLDISNNEGLYKQLLVGYIEGATNAIDTAFDGASLDIGNPIMIYSIVDDVKLGIQGRALPFNENDVIALGCKATVAGTFEFKLSNFDGLFANQDIYLEDSLQNVFYNLKNGNYSFETEIGTFDNRFKIHFTDPTALNTHLVDTNSVLVYHSFNQIVVNSGTINMKQLALYDIQGRLIEQYDVKNTSEFKFDSPTTNQVVVLKITTTDNKVFFKKIL